MESTSLSLLFVLDDVQADNAKIIINKIDSNFFIIINPLLLMIQLVPLIVSNVIPYTYSLFVPLFYFYVNVCYIMGFRLEYLGFLWIDFPP